MGHPELRTNLESRPLIQLGVLVALPAMILVLHVAADVDGDAVAATRYLPGAVRTVQEEPSDTKRPFFDLFDVGPGRLTSVSITADGYTVHSADYVPLYHLLGTRGDEAPARDRDERVLDVPLVDGKYDDQRLGELFWQLKQEFPDERRIILIATTDTDLAIINRVMDLCREHEGRVMFDEIVLSPGLE